MAKQVGQKLKTLILAQTLLAQSDEGHPLTIQRLIEALERHGISAERKSIYRDLTELQDYGMDLQCRKGKTSGWFVGSRDFELVELKLLVDAVQSSKFITTRKSDILIHKLERLSSVHEARQLQRQVYVDRRVKTMNESIYYNVDKLHAAIAAQKAVTFRYFDYGMERQRVFRRGGARYTVSPYGLMWNSENYYLVGWDGINGEIRHYRVDKMSEIAITFLPNVPPTTGFTLEGYAGKHFSMFSGTQGALCLRCPAGMAGVVIDRFGQDAILVPEGEDHFTVTLQVVVSPQFFGWLFGLGAGVELLSPPWARLEYGKQLAAVAAQYTTEHICAGFDCNDGGKLL